jgi:endonuclease YncB( thermonuclease family)
MTKYKLLFLAAMALLYSCVSNGSGPKTASQPEDNCRVVHISDGDTFDVKCNGQPQERIRLMGYDTPETYYADCPAEKALGDEATARLRTLTETRQITRIERHGRGKYGRVLARVWLEGTDLADIMVSEGLAMRYSGGHRANWCALLGE